MALLGWLQRNVVAGEASPAREVLVTGACVGLATAARWLLSPALGDALPFAPYYPAVLAAALSGGWRAGTATLLLSSAAGWFFFIADDEAPGLTALDGATVVTFILTAGLILAASALLRQALNELVAARELGDTLNRELQHRVKNTLMVVQSLAAQTVRRSGDLQAFDEAFQGRLRALGLAHDVLIAGKLKHCRLPQLAQDALRPFTETFQERISIRGEAASLPAEACVPLILALHELATNAVKYGSLSNESGEVDLQWLGGGSEGCETVRLVWTERDGPPVSPPTRYGLGSRWLRAAPSQHLEDVRWEFAATGLVCEILVGTGDRRS